MTKIAFKGIVTGVLCALISPLVVAQREQVDLSMRRAIYITASKTGIDTKNDRYVGDGRVMTVKKSQAVSCQGDTCTFNLGVFAFRSGGGGGLSTYGQFTGKTLGIVGNTILFNAGETIKQQVLPVPLKVGRNEVTFTIDPQNKTPEKDENNNRITVMITVE